MVRIPDIQGNQWINSQPLTSNDIAGNVVLYDFWAYSCVNCQRTLPFLREWWERYREKKFLIIGIHTPEFDFEKDEANVRAAVKSLRVLWPVVLDSERRNWNTFANRYWPAKYLADPDGNIVYTHFGEGEYAETEKAIRSSLGLSGDMPAVHQHEHGGVCVPATQELYCGYARGVIDNLEGYGRETSQEYRRPTELSQNSIALSGAFFAASEYVRFEEIGSRLFLEFTGTEVNLVLRAVPAPAKLRIMLNGKELPRNVRGMAVDERGFAVVSNATLYGLIKSAVPITGTLEIILEEGKAEAYAFTFSGCSEK